MTEPNEPQVIIVGAGPGGLCLAGELALAGIRVTVLERRGRGSRESRALGLQARTLELLALRGLVAPFLERGNPVDHFRITVGDTRIRLAKLDSDFRQVNICPQYFIEQVLEQRATENGAEVRRGVRVLDVRQTGDTVAVRMRDANGTRTERAAWVVGCDGPNSLTRDAVGIGFPGCKYPYHVMFADVRLREQPPHGAYMRVTRRGLGIGFDFGDGRWRIGSLERLPLQPPGEVSLDELDAGLRRVFGHSLGPHDPLWTSRAVFRLGHATAYRRGRVLLLGDAAHVQSPLGGQGLNLTLQDALNLGWKLAVVASGRAGDDLLDTYELERRSVATKVLRVTDRGMRLLMSGKLPQRALRRVLLPTLTSIPPVHDKIAGYLSGVGFSYPLPRTVSRARAGALAGSRLPNAVVRLTNGDDVRLYDQFVSGRFVLVDQSGGRLAAACGPWQDRVVVLDGRVQERPDLAAYEGILGRPDGYCAWAGSADPGALQAALGFWCGVLTDATAPAVPKTFDVTTAAEG